MRTHKKMAVYLDAPRYERAVQQLAEAMLAARQAQAALDLFGCTLPAELREWTPPWSFGDLVADEMAMENKLGHFLAWADRILDGWAIEKQASLRQGRPFYVSHAIATLQTLTPTTSGDPAAYREQEGEADGDQER